MKIRLVYLLIAFLCVSGFQLTSIAQSNKAKLKSLTEGADVILTGKVVQQNSSWNENRTRIFTRATLQVDEYLKGNNNGKSVEVIYPGGEVGDVGEFYTHIPRFTSNEEVLVFLKRDKKSEFKVFDGENGKIAVLNDKKTGEKVTNSSVRVNYLKEQIKNYLNTK